MIAFALLLIVNCHQKVVQTTVRIPQTDLVSIDRLNAGVTELGRDSREDRGNPTIVRFEFEGELGV